MKRNLIRSDELLAYQANQWNEFASCSLPMPNRPGFTARLVLSFNGSGSYKVVLGNQTLYEGNDPEVAIATWNQAD